jgi:transcriptional regulator with XRE-family HTH domain
VSNYETGKRGVPLGTAMRLAAALDVTLCYLVELEGQHLVIPSGSRLARAAEIFQASPELLDHVLGDGAGA